MLRLLAFVAALTFPLAAFAMGGGASPSPDYVRAEKLIKEWKYSEAIPILEKLVIAEPKNADAQNQLGYANRKLNRLAEAKEHYGLALDIQHDHRGALEYQGEMFLMLNDLAKAEENLDKLDKFCFFGCDEYTDLKKAIAAYKIRRGISS